MTLPVAELCHRAREAGIRTVSDGAHVPGHIPLDLRALDPGSYAANCHKWQFHFSESEATVGCASVREMSPKDKGGKRCACRPHVSLSRSAGCEPRKSSLGAAR
jgi:hypothetical protein